MGAKAGLGWGMQQPNQALMWFGFLCTFLLGLLVGAFVRRDQPAKDSPPGRVVTSKIVSDGTRASADTPQPVVNLAEDLRARKTKIVENLWSNYKDDPVQLARLRQIGEEDFAVLGDDITPEERESMSEIWRELQARAAKVDGGRGK